MDIDWEQHLLHRSIEQGQAYGQLMVIEMIRQGRNTLEEIQAAQRGVDSADY